MTKNKLNRHNACFLILILSFDLSLSACTESVSDSKSDQESEPIPTPTPTETPTPDPEPVSYGRETSACFSPNVAVTEIDVGVPVMGYGQEGNTDPLPMAVVALPSSGSRLAWLGTDNRVYLAKLDCNDQLVGTPTSIPALDLQDLHADDEGGVVLVTRNATNGSCVDIHQGDRMQVVDSNGSLVAGGNCDGTLFGGDLVLSSTPGYWTVWSQGGQARLEHFTTGESDTTISTDANTSHPHLVSYGSERMLLSWNQAHRWRRRSMTRVAARPWVTNLPSMYQITTTRLSRPTRTAAWPIRRQGVVIRRYG